MTPEAARHLRKAKDLLVQADRAIVADLADAAGRAAYLAGFHAAQAVIFDHTRQVSKTHRGVHAAFALLAKNEPAISQTMRAFLGRAYNLKALAD